MNNVEEIQTEDNPIHEFVVMKPREFKEITHAIQALCDRKSVLLNLTMMEPQEAQRAVDFITGGTYSVSGHQQRIGEKVFLFTPSGIQVSTMSDVVHKVPQPQMPADYPVAPTSA